MSELRADIRIVGVDVRCCEAEKGDGEMVFGCKRMECAACRFRELLETLQRNGARVLRARLTYSPGSPAEVTDDLFSRRRRGTFGR